MTAIDL